MLFSVEQVFVGRDERWAPLKTSAWEATVTKTGESTFTIQIIDCFFLGGGSGVGLNWVLLYVNENAKWSAELFRILNIILDLKIVFQTDIFQNVMLHASDKTTAFTYGNFGYKIKQVFIRSSYNNYYYLYKESLPENDQLKFKTLLGTYFLQLLDFQT